MLDWAILRRWITLSCLLLASQLGCEPKSDIDIEADNQAGRPIVVKVQGTEFEFPAAIEFDGRTWIRGSEMRKLLNGFVFWDYYGSDPNIKVKYTQYPSKELFQETFVTYRRADPQSPWKEHGKMRLIEPNGAWYESFNDPDVHLRSNGPLRYSYANGVVKFSSYERGGLKIGPAEGFYPDGSPYWKGEFMEDGSADYRKWQFWGSDGEQLQDLDFDEKILQHDRWRKLRSEELSG